MNFSDELKQLANDYEKTDIASLVKKEIENNYPSTVERLKNICLNRAKCGERKYVIWENSAVRFIPASWDGLNSQELQQVRSLVHGYISKLLINAGFTDFEIHLNDINTSLTFWHKSYRLYIDRIVIKW